MAMKVTEAPWFPILRQYGQCPIVVSIATRHTDDMEFLERCDGHHWARRRCSEKYPEYSVHIVKKCFSKGRHWVGHVVRDVCGKCVEQYYIDMEYESGGGPMG
jgi:hypothetical protein